jgi:hypothetical protein
MLTKLMTGNNSGAPRLTIFVLTPAAANELFTVGRVADAVQDGDGYVGGVPDRRPGMLRGAFEEK